MDPLDFPQVYQRPSSSSLLTTLDALALTPPIWGHEHTRTEILREQEHISLQKRAETGVGSWLSTIIGSDLSWLEEEEKEAVWEAASKRMSERCGRGAMGEIIRRWPFKGTVEGDKGYELIIKEPGMTGDSIGFKTWGSSYALAQRLPLLAETSLKHLFNEGSTEAQLKAVELGSGTGLLGMAAAASWKLNVALSDLPSIVPNLRANSRENIDMIKARGGSLQVGDLTWGGSPEEIDQPLFGQHNQFKIVLVADPMYDDNHPTLLADAISQHLAFGSESRAVVMVPQRDQTTKGLLQAFRAAIVERGIVPIEEDWELTGQDDWEEDDEVGPVKCWLGIFSREVSSA